MPFNTVTVSAAITPTVVETYFSHYLNRKPLHQKPVAHISYHEGLTLIRQFLNYASHHTVEEIQGFTSQWVPNPRWVKVDEVKIPQEQISKAAKALQEQLGHKGIQKVGGETWWLWRRDNADLKAEWIEMRAHYTERKKKAEKSKRVMLYVHGGAYFFGSVDEHRYQMQRHARKLKAKVFARCRVLTILARYRLAPQFPFPCGLLDCLAAYMFLLTEQDASHIVLAGDSAGAGMLVSMMVIMRDQGIPLPAGAILISPWVDLTHSFPSVAGDGSRDYIPSHGFMQRPSAAWPPPNTDDMISIAKSAVSQISKSMDLPREKEKEAIQGFSVTSDPDVPESEKHGGKAGAGQNEPTGVAGNTAPGPGHDLAIMIDGELVEIKDQIQMYTTNHLISHPLVSPILQPSLGGLPPLLILTGGGEVLRDEQIYLAHKAANPTKYPPGDAYLDENPHSRDIVNQWKGTDVQLQVWDDCCHVTPTLSFTRPAKFMYRSIAQFGAWTLARAQKTNIEIMDDDDVSVISSDSDTNESEEDLRLKKRQATAESANGTAQVGRAGDPLPPFRNHMIRQRVDRHGVIYPLDPPSKLPSLKLPPSEIGVIKEGPVRNWMAAKRHWDNKYSHEKRRVQKQRAREMVDGFEGFGDDEVPPPSALAGRRGANMPKEAKKGRSWGMSLWSVWGSKHDEKTIEREEKADAEPDTATATENDGANARPLEDAYRSRSRHRNVNDAGQTEGQTHDEDIDENTPAVYLLNRKNEDSNLLGPTTIAEHDRPANGTIPSSTRPKAGSVAYPFKLASPDNRLVNPSMRTLKSEAGVIGTVEGEADGSSE